MKFTTVAVSLCASSFAFAADAPALTNNPVDAQYLATMPASGDPGVYAQFAVLSGPDGAGVQFAININGKVFDGGPFLYHIHDKAVSSDGNCTATGTHLDPYNRGESPPCDKSSPASCQVGDLSGKHGTIPALPGFSANYTDNYLSLNPSDPAFFGDRSVVLHFANKTRIACANFQLTNKKPDSPIPAFNSTPTSLSPLGLNGSSTAAPTPITPTAPIAPIAPTAPIAPSSIHATASASSTTGAPKPSTSALSAATGIKIKHVNLLLGPVLLGLACMV